MGSAGEHLTSNKVMALDIAPQMGAFFIYPLPLWLLKLKLLQKNRMCYSKELKSIKTTFYKQTRFMRAAFPLSFFIECGLLPYGIQIQLLLNCKGCITVPHL